MTGDGGGTEYAGGEKELRAFEAEFLRAHGPIPPLADCPIGWQPSALTPVFYGFRDYDAPQGAPGKTRVFFPSLDGSPQDAELLVGCGRYPVIVFAHGHCQGDVDHYMRWFRLPGQLARSGYVVVVPQLPAIGGHPSSDQATQDILADALTWIRQGWERGDSLLPPPATGLVGHSFGALHAGILATRIDCAGLVSLSGVWIDWPNGPAGQRPILQLQIPQLFTWGTELFSERDAILPDSLWSAIAKPKHRAVFTDGEHFDYLYTPQLPCRQSKGPCRWLGAATDDLVAMFFANYLPPELWPNLPDQVPDTLIPPPLNLTPEQEFFAGAHLIGMGLFNGEAQCSVAITRELPTDRTVPYVRFTPRNLAAQMVQQRDLVPVFTGPNHTASWVFTQNPAPGATISVGSQVRMALREGAIP
jgi:hypothetical protein